MSTPYRMPYRGGSYPPLFGQREPYAPEVDTMPTEPLQQPKPPGSAQQVRDHLGVALERLCSALLACEDREVSEYLASALGATKRAQLEALAFALEGLSATG